MKPSRFLVIGGANLDITGTCTNPLRPADSNPGVVTSTPGGVGRNIAENLQRLGNNTSLLTLVGDDLGRNVIFDSCHKAGIDVSNIVIDKTRSTGTYLAINDEQGGLSVAVSDMTIIDQLTPKVLARYEHALSNADEIVIEANLSTESIQWIAERAKNKAIHADAVSATKVVRLKPALNKLDILKVNRQEAEQLLGWQGEELSMAKALFELGVKQVLLSLGAQGALLYSDQGAIHQAAKDASNHFDNGSGDALFCGLVAAQKCLKSKQHQLEFAVSCATFTLACANAVNPDLSVEAVKQHFLTHIPQGDWF